MKGTGLDIGTNMLVAATMNADGKPVYKKERDAFLKLTPKSEVNRKSIKLALDSRKAPYILSEGEFIVVGEEALMMANERNVLAQRPMSRGVLSPKEKDSLPMIRLLIKSLVGEGDQSKLVFSVPATPINSDFDIFFHSEVIKSYLKELGFAPTSINEGFAIAFSELLDDNLTGLCLSFGAGMVNVTLCYEGDPTLEFAIPQGGDWIDESVAKAVDENPSWIQIEKEQNEMDLFKPADKIQEAIAIYYRHLMEYVVNTTIFELNKRKLPAIRGAMPVIVAGGLTLIKSFKQAFELEIATKKFPFKIKEVRIANEPLTCVAHGCLMAVIL